MKSNRNKCIAAVLCLHMVKFMVFGVLFSVLASSCGTTSTVPVTGRKHNLLVTDEYVLSLSSQEYTKYMQTAKKSTDQANTQLVKRVGQRLASAVEQYLIANNMAEEVKNYSWEFNLVKDNAANAFCMPGGKIVVYEGLLPYTQNEASLAIVLGHEIAHAVAKHSAEQMSKQIKAQYGQQILGGLLQGAGAGALGTQAAQNTLGIINTLGQKRYSRQNESEADYMGLVFAAMAGYDPSVAVPFWQRMSSGNTSSTPAFLSDHPSDAKRIADIKKWLPEAEKYYKGGANANSTQHVSQSTAAKSTTTGKTTTKQPATAGTIRISHKK